MFINVWNKYRKFRKSEISYILKKTFRLSIAYSKCGHEYEKINSKKNNQLKY